MMFVMFRLIKFYSDKEKYDNLNRVGLFQFQPTQLQPRLRVVSPRLKTASKVLS